MNLCDIASTGTQINHLHEAITGELDVGTEELVVVFYNVDRVPSSDPVTLETTTHAGSNNIEFRYGLISY